MSDRWPDYPRVPVAGNLPDMRAWRRTYSAAETLLEYVSERWRSDPYVYGVAQAPRLGDHFELIWLNV